MLTARLSCQFAILVLYVMSLSLSAQVIEESGETDTTLSELREVLSQDRYRGNDWSVYQPEDELNQLREIGSRSIPMLKELLQDKEPMTRINAATALKLLGPEARPAFVLLTKALNDPVPRVQIEACAAIAAIGPEAHAAIPLIAQLLSRTQPYHGGAHWSWYVSNHAKDALVAMGEDVVPEFAKRIHDKDVIVRMNCVKGLGELANVRSSAASAKSPMARFADVVKSENRIATTNATDVETSPAVSALIEALGDDDAIVRLNVAHALCKYGRRATAAVPELANHLTDSGKYGIGYISRSTKYVRADMARAIVVIGATEKVLPKLLIHLRADPPKLTSNEEISSDYYEAQFYIALAIGTLGEKAKRAEHFLTESLKNDVVKFAAAVALLQIDPHNPRSREIVLGSLPKENRISVPVLQTVRRLNWKDAETLAALRSATEAYEIHSALLAECRLLQLDPGSKENREAFCKDILHKDMFSTWGEFRDHDVWELEFLSLLRETPVAAKLVLTAALQNMDSEFTQPYAQPVIEAAGWQAGEFVPRYTKDLSVDSIETRRNAAFLLGLFGPTSKPAVPPLVHALQDSRPVVRSAAARSLGQIGVFDKTVIEGLTSRLHDEYATVRVAAATSIANSGKAGKPALDALKELSNDELKSVRDAARQAIGVLNRVSF